MKVAIVTNDGKTVSQHFGRSRYYKIVTIENGKVVSEELRERRTGHFAPGQRAGLHHSHHGSMQGGHGYGPEADEKHRLMAQEISDCDMLIAGGMGRGAYESFRNAGLNVVLTNMSSIDQVIQLLIEDSLTNLGETLTD